MLAFLGQEVVGHAKKAFDGDRDAHFFESFAEGAVVKSFEVFELAADDAPAACFRRKLAKREERAAAVVEDEDTNANPRNGACSAEIVAMRHGWSGRGAGCGGGRPYNSFGRDSLNERVQRGKETFGQGVTTEENSGIDGVAP